MQRGLSVHHGNVEEGLDHYGDQMFDLVIMSLIIQEIADPQRVVDEAFRVGKQVIIVFPNFGHWRCRGQLALRGRAPRTSSCPYTWCASPNRHFFTVTDWELFCDEQRWLVREKNFLSQGRTVRLLPNLRAEVAMYLMQKGN